MNNENNIPTLEELNLYYLRSGAILSYSGVGVSRLYTTRNEGSLVKRYELRMKFLKIANLYRVEKNTTVRKKSYRKLVVLEKHGA